MPDVSGLGIRNGRQLGKAEAMHRRPRRGQDLDGRDKPGQDELECLLLDYCAGLIAQETLTETCSVSSPWATGAAAAMPTDILRTGICTGPPPPSEMSIGAPSVTPAALA